MTEFYLYRHGKTKGNEGGRYLGRTDESLSEEGKKALREKRIPSAEAVFSSPKKRCQETAALFFPGQCRIIVPDFRECDFGIFENKNWRELSGNPAYQKWIDSGGTLPFPGGESGERFQKRCREAFLEVLAFCKREGIERAALVIHGGTIRSILSAWGEPARGFYDWNPKNGGGYRIRVKEGEPLSLEILEEIT